MSLGVKKSVPGKLPAISKVLYVLESIGLGVCIAYAALCWFADFSPATFHLDQMSPGYRAKLLEPAGLVTTGIGLILSIVAFRRRRVFSILTACACGLWVIWALLPRL